MTSKERRQHQRVKIDKAVKFRNGSGEFDGRLTDISTSGASVNAENFDDILDDEQDVEIDMYDFGVLAGSIVRTLDDGFAV